jgi:hypothetical protein
MRGRRDAVADCGAGNGECAARPSPARRWTLPCEHAVRIQQNRRGQFVVFAAPFFGAYTRRWTTRRRRPKRSSIRCAFIWR